MTVEEMKKDIEEERRLMEEHVKRLEQDILHNYYERMKTLRTECLKQHGQHQLTNYGAYMYCARCNATYYLEEQMWQTP